MNFDNSIPLYHQAVDYLKKQMAVGKLRAGDKLPSGRQLSEILTINPNTVARVYGELEREGLCFTKRGLGTFVIDDEDKVNSIKEQLANESVARLIREFESIGLTKDDAIKKIREN